VKLVHRVSLIKAKGGDLVRVGFGSDLSPGGEIYVSQVLPGSVKGWKKNLTCASRFIVLSGTLVFHALSLSRSEQGELLTARDKFEVGLGQDFDVVVPSGSWYAIENRGTDVALVANVLSTRHSQCAFESREFEVDN
jgi:mannose-6-phosphate isomerase-like protein (cupin superfamily)